MCCVPRLALALPVVMPVAELYYFYRPRDQPANNNKGGEGEKAQQLRHPPLGLGDMQCNTNSARYMMTNLNLPSRSAEKYSDGHNSFRPP